MREGAEAFGRKSGDGLFAEIRVLKDTSTKNHAFDGDLFRDCYNPRDQRVVEPAGDVAGNELLYAAAPVILAGLLTATLLNTVVLPAACLWFGPARAPRRDDLPRPPDVPQPREEPDALEVPPVAARPENPVS